MNFGISYLSCFHIDRIFQYEALYLLLEVVVTLSVQVVVTMCDVVQPKALGWKLFSSCAFDKVFQMLTFFDCSFPIVVPPNHINMDSSSVLEKTELESIYYFSGKLNKLYHVVDSIDTYFIFYSKLKFQVYLANKHLRLTTLLNSGCL